MAGKLTQLDIGETSGVDHPAHLAEGWMLMKSKDGAFAAKVAELLKDSTKECASCGAAVPNGDAYCPECGNKADGGDMEKAGSLDRLRNLHKAIGELISEGGEMSDDAVKDEATDDEMLKSVPPAVRDLILKERAERETLATELAKAREERATEQAIAKAKGWSGLGIDADEFGVTVAKLRGLDEELAKAVEDVLDGANTIVEASNLFKSVGRDAPAEGSAEGKLDALTKEYMSKSTDTVDYATAQAAVLETPEGSALYDAVAQAAMKGE